MLLIRYFNIMHNLYIQWCPIFFLICFSSIGDSHHSFDYHFDRDKKITVEGLIKEYRFINPHSHLLINVVNEEGSIEVWDCELPPANILRRSGWSKDTLPEGERIIVTGSAAIRSDTECAYDYGVFSDGTKIGSRHVFNTKEQKNNSNDNVEPVLDNSIPNLSGVWIMLRSNFESNGIGYGGMGGPPGPNEPNPWIGLFSGLGIKALNEYDPILNDPAFNCSPVSISRLWRNGQPIEISQGEKSISINYEWMDAKRVINLEGIVNSNHINSTLGYSVGEYDGSSLIVRTKDYSDGVIHQHPGLPNSSELESTEVITLDPDSNILSVSWIYRDPLYWLDTYSEQRSFQKVGGPLEPYNCQH